MGDRLRVRCLGFLDATTCKETCLDSGDIEFIHRSAKEFIESDAEGQALLEFDMSTRQERHFRVSKAQLAQSFLYHLGDIDISSWSFHDPDELKNFM